MVARLLLSLLLVATFAGTAAAMCDELRVVKKPTVVASADGASAPRPVKRPATSRTD